MAGPSGERCATCYFYMQGRPGMAKGETDKCNRFPPVVNVYFDHWCGEWAPRKSESAPRITKSEVGKEETRQP